MKKIKTNSLLSLKIIAVLLCMFMITSCSKEDATTGDSDTNNLPHFSWDITVQLEQPNNWGLTLFENKVTVTNIVEGKQYILTWKGNLSAGEKSNGKLKTIILGKQTKTTELEVLEIKELSNGTHEIFFRGGGRKGEIVF